jgi:hypothetical protein
LLRAHVGLECEPAALGDVAGVDVAPEIPAPQGRVAPEGGKPLVLLRFHYVRESKRDVRRSGPPVQLATELFCEQFRKRVTRLRKRRVFLVDRRIRRLFPLERESEDRLARRPDDAT